MSRTRTKYGRYIASGRLSTKVQAPPGGRSSLSLGWNEAPRHKNKNKQAQQQHTLSMGEFSRGSGGREFYTQQQEVYPSHRSHHQYPREAPPRSQYQYPDQHVRHHTDQNLDRDDDAVAYQRYLAEQERSEIRKAKEAAALEQEEYYRRLINESKADLLHSVQESPPHDYRYQHQYHV